MSVSVSPAAQAKLQTFTGGKGSKYTSHTCNDDEEVKREVRNSRFGTALLNPIQPSATNNGSESKEDNVNHHDDDDDNEDNESIYFNSARDVVLLCSPLCKVLGVDQSKLNIEKIGSWKAPSKHGLDNDRKIVEEKRSGEAKGVPSQRFQVPESKSMEDNESAPAIIASVASKYVANNARNVNEDLVQSHRGEIGTSESKDDDDDDDYDRSDGNDTQITMSANLMAALGMDISGVDTTTDWKPPTKPGLEYSDPIVPKGGRTKHATSDKLIAASGTDISDVDTTTDWKPSMKSGMARSDPIEPKRSRNKPAMSANLMAALGMDISGVDTTTDWKPPMKSGLEYSDPIVPKGSIKSTRPGKRH